MDDMTSVQSHMDDASSTWTSRPGPGNPEHMLPGDMDGDGMVPPPPTR